MNWSEVQKVAIHSVPRSGSTWLGEIINSSHHVKYCYQPLFSYALKDYLNLNSEQEEIENFFAELSCTDDDFILQKEAREKGILPRDFIKRDISHIVYKEVRYHHLVRRILAQTESLKVVMLIRNPLEVMASWIRAPREFDGSWNIDEELIHAQKKNQGLESNFYGLAKWADAATEFLRLEQEFPDRVIIVDYNSLKKNTLDNVGVIFKFLKLPLEQQTIDFIGRSQTKHNHDKYSVFKSKQSCNSWQELFSEKQIKIIQEFTIDRQLQRFL